MRPLMTRPELLALDLRGKTYLITGANAGIGLETTRQLARQGACVVMACRRVAQANEAAQALRRELPAALLEVLPLDLGDLASVRTAAREFLARHARLDGLVNNAGVMNTPQGQTRDGFETQFGINHLGHFLLTALLLERLKASVPARIVNVSSAFHVHAMGRVADIHFDDLNYRQRRYDGWEAYAQSKLANLLHARHLARLLQGTGVTCVSVHPGWVRTQLMQHTLPLWLQNSVLRHVLHWLGMIEPWEGAQSTLHTLLAPEVATQSGEYFSQPGLYRNKTANQGGWPMRSPHPLAYDPAVAERLWQVSMALVGEKVE